jgi:hypothetical protein
MLLFCPGRRRCFRMDTLSFNFGSSSCVTRSLVGRGWKEHRWRRGGDGETTIVRRRSSEGGYGVAQLGDFLKPHRRQLKFPCGEGSGKGPYQAPEHASWRLVAGDVDKEKISLVSTLSPFYHLSFLREFPSTIFLLCSQFTVWLRPLNHDVPIGADLIREDQLSQKDLIDDVMMSMHCSFFQFLLPKQA